MPRVTINSAFPLETDLIQLGKAILLAASITQAGGTVILLSAYPDGAGPLMYETLLQRPDSDQVIDWIAEGRASITGGLMAFRLRRLLATEHLMIVTDGLTPEQLANREMEHASSVEYGIAQVSQRHVTADVIVLPIGGSTLPFVEQVPDESPV